MAKIFGPLLSIGAKGVFGGILSYGRNRFGCWVRRIVKPKYPCTPAQATQRNIFKDGIQSWIGESPIIKYAWYLFGRDKADSPYCFWMKEYLRNKGPFWNGYPWPPPFPTEQTLYFLHKYWWPYEDKLQIGYWVHLLSRRGYYQAPGWDAGFDLYHSDVKDENDPSFEHVKQYIGGNRYYKIPWPGKPFIAVKIFDMHGLYMPLEWINDWEVHRFG